jgi:sorting nexin-5/6/32
MRDSKAALDLLYRRSRSLADLETANKNLDKARMKNKEIQVAESNQQNMKSKFETISEKAKDGNRRAYVVNMFTHVCCTSSSIELSDFKVRRVTMFRKNLIELSELQIKHAKVSVMRSTNPTYL